MLPLMVPVSLALCQTGLEIPGRVFSKREDAVVLYSTWKRSAEITIEYDKPDHSGVSFLKVPMAPAEYDTMPLGKAVRLHYSKGLILPTVRLERRPILSLGGPAPSNGWLAAVGFPKPTPAPVYPIRQAAGRVKSLARIDRLFSDVKTAGLIADAPIEVAGIEFTPEGRTEPVLAVDLIDAGSIPGLKERSLVSVDYETGSPRTAYIRAPRGDSLPRTPPESQSKSSPF